MTLTHARYIAMAQKKYRPISKEELFEVLYRLGLEPEAAAIRLGISHERLRKYIMEYDLRPRTVAIQLVRERDANR